MKLTIEAFRGANEPFALEFDSKGNLSIVYGENGSGKTTISDALEFLFHGTAGSLEEKSLDGKSRIPALVHAQRAKADLLVKWEDGQSKTVARIDKTKAQISGDSPGVLHTLSRKNITRLIEETPTKRFERIQEFVSVPALDREEAELRNFMAQQKQLQESQLRSAQQVEADLDQLHQSATLNDSPPPARDVWMKMILGESSETVGEHLKVFEDLDHQITRLRGDFKTIQNAYARVEECDVAHVSAQESLSKIVAASTGDFSEALETLEQAQLLFQRKPTDACPICDTNLTHQKLTEKVARKLSRLKTVAAQSAKTKQAQTALQQAKNSLETLQSSLFATIDTLRQSHQSARDMGEWSVPDIVPALLAPSEAGQLTDEWFQTLVNEAAGIKPLSEFVGTQKTQLHKRNETQNQLRSILARRKDTQKEHAALGLIIQKADAIATILREHRIRHANETLVAISEDFAELYSFIHPGEEIEKIRLYLHPTQRNAARFDGTLFGNTEMTPVACLSDSHLDTLGLCLFLALQKRENPANSIVYLDDAIASVDEAHMERLYELLLREAEHFRHLIITSHYQPLRFKFRWGLLTQSKVNFIELGHWSLERGLTLAKGPNSEIAYLRKYLAEAEDASTIASKAGMVLERVFDFLTGIYQCRLPRNPGAEQRWTLDHYKGGLKSEKKLMGALRCDHIDPDGKVFDSIELAPLLEDIFSRLQFRNAIGCHYKELAGYFDEIGEAVKLGQATLALVNALCDENDELPDNQKDGTSWANRKTVTRRLYPLLKPA